MISRIAVSWSQAYCHQTLQCIFPWITVPKANSRLFQQVFCRCQQSCTWPWTSWVWSFYHTFSLQIGSVVTLGLRLPTQPSIALRSAGMFVNEISHRGFLQEDKRSLPSIKTKKVRSFFKHLMFTQLSCEGVKGWRCFCLKHDIDLLKNIYIYIIYAGSYMAYSREGRFSFYKVLEWEVCRHCVNISYWTQGYSTWKIIQVGK